MPENGYEIKVIDDRWRELDAAMIDWELDGGRKVRVAAVFAEGTPWFRSGYETQPTVWVSIFEDDEMGDTHAVITLPDNGRGGGIRSEAVPALVDVIARAEAIAANANARIAAALAEYLPQAAG